MLLAPKDSLYVLSFAWQKGGQNFIFGALHGKKMGGSPNEDPDLFKGPLPIGTRGHGENIN